MTSGQHISDRPRARRLRGRPAGADPVLRRDEILTAAAELFATDGFRAVSMSAVARACNLSQTGLTHHFATKDELLAAVLARRDVTDSAQLFGGNGVRRGVAFLDSLVDLVEHNEQQPDMVRLFTVLAGEAVDPAHPASEWLRAHHRRFRGYVETALREAVEDGDLRPDTPVESVARLLAAVLDGLQLQWLSDPDYARMTGEARLALDAVKGAYGVRVARGRARSLR